MRSKYNRALEILDDINDIHRGYPDPYKSIDDLYRSIDDLIEEVYALGYDVIWDDDAEEYIIS